MMVRRMFRKRSGAESDAIYHGPWRAGSPLDSITKRPSPLSSLAHPHRLRIVQMLLRGRYTVGELAEACDIPSHMASEHLRLMQHCGLLQSERDGRKNYYEIAEKHLGNIMNCVESRFG